MYRDGCSQGTSCAQAQHDAHTSDVAQSTECQGVNGSEACDTSEWVAEGQQQTAARCVRQRVWHT
jgi:hypothetical protein